MSTPQVQARVGEFLRGILQERLSSGALDFLSRSTAEIAEGVDAQRMGILFAISSRHGRDRVLLDLTQDERQQAEALIPGWNPARWGVLETLRAVLWMARGDLNQPSCCETIEALFAHADEGECRALYRLIPLLPNPDDYRWRMQEGCRTNIVPVFEAVACDNPYPAQHFDDVAWRQMVIKSLFLEAPLWRVHGLDGRLDEDLARMALDLVEERTSAGRPIQPDLWLCLGPFEQERALPLVMAEIDGRSEEGSEKYTDEGRCAAILALGRALQEGRLEALIRAQDPLLTPWAQAAQTGDCSQAAFGRLPGRVPTNP